MTENYERFDLYQFLEGRLSDYASPREFSQGTTIYSNGDCPNGFFYLRKGLVGLVYISPQGAESLLRIFAPFTFFGHRTFLAEEPYHGTAIALKDSEACFISEEKAQKMIHDFPDLRDHFLKVLSKDLRKAENRLRDMTSKKVASRIIESLIFLKNRYPSYKWTRREIGEFCGAKTETVSRVLGQLEKSQLIEKDGRDILILDEKKLIQEAHKDD